MSDFRLTPLVLATLDALQPSARPIAAVQLTYARGEDDQLITLAEVWRLVEEGRDAAGVARWFRNTRMREARDMRRAGCGLDAADLADQDPTSASLAALEYVTATTTAGWANPAAPSSIEQEPALPVVETARGSRRGLRTVQTKMRRACLEELAGQGVLFGVPPAGEVFKARALGGAK